MTGKCVYLFLLSLSPALIIPIKVILERYIYDYAQQIYDTGNLPKYAGFLFGIVLLIQILYIVTYSIYRSNINFIGSDLEIILQNQINEKTSKMPLLSFEQADLYKKIELACNVSRDLRFMIMMFVSEVFVYTVSFLSVTGVLGTYHYTLVLMGIFAVLPDIVTKVVQAKIQYLALDRLQETTRVKKYFQDLLTHLDYNKEIRVYHTKEYFLKKWNEKNEEYNGERKKLIRYHLKVSLICNGISFLSMAGSLVLVIFLVWQKK